MHKLIYRLVFLVFICTISGLTTAANIDLSTVPQRQTVQLTIYNSEDLTLVRETRTISFKQGANPLQFSWANTLIDPTSVELRFPNNATVDVLDTTFPHDKPQMLYWNVLSDTDQEAQVEISYFTSGISWSADYIALLDDTDNSMNLQSYVRVQNDSGENYEAAQVRLVVGKINLVEKIAQLARIPVGQVQQLGQDQFRTLKQKAVKAMVARQEMAMAAAPVPSRPKEIIKEGLSEYFIYTIEGTETVPTGWSKRLRSFVADEVPVTLNYRYRRHQYGDQLVQMVLLRNDAESGLGSTPLPDGTIRVFRNNVSGSLSYLSQQAIKYIPIGEDIELNLGADPDVIFELIKHRVWRDQLWIKLQGSQLYQRIDAPGIRLELEGKIAGWNEHHLYSQRIRNYTGRAINVEVRRQFQGDATFRSQLEASKHDVNTVQFSTIVNTGDTAELFFQLTQRQGYNQKQQRLELQSGEVN